jgi:acetyltransferase-like isoleucine patch superfamily enzyme
VRVAGDARLGRDLRLRIAPGAQLVLGPRCAVGDGASFTVDGGRVTVGEAATLGDRCRLVVVAGASIGPRSRLGDGVVLVDAERDIEDVELPIRCQPVLAARIDVGEGAVVGPAAALLRGAVVPARARVPARGVVGPHDVKDLARVKETVDDYERVTRNAPPPRSR